MRPSTKELRDRDERCNYDILAAHQADGYSRGDRNASLGSRNQRICGSMPEEVCRPPRQHARRRSHDAPQTLLAVSRFFLLTLLWSIHCTQDRKCAFRFRARYANAFHIRRNRDGALPAELRIRPNQCVFRGVPRSMRNHGEYSCGQPLVKVRPQPSPRHAAISLYFLGELRACLAMPVCQMLQVGDTCSALVCEFLRPFFIAQISDQLRYLGSHDFGR